MVLAVFILLAIAADATASAADSGPARMVLVLDASGSMWGQIEGQAKITIAKVEKRIILASRVPISAPQATRDTPIRPVAIQSK